MINLQEYFLKYHESTVVEPGAIDFTCPIEEAEGASGWDKIKSKIAFKDSPGDSVTKEKKNFV